MRNKDEKIVGDIIKVTMDQKYLDKFADINTIQMLDRKSQLKMTFTKTRKGDPEQ